MGKFLRSVKGENIRLFASASPLLSVIAVFLIALVTAWIIGANSSEGGLVSEDIKNAVNSAPVSVKEEYTVEITYKNPIQNVITNNNISDSDISGSDISGSDVSQTDTKKEEIKDSTVVETHSYKTWQDAYRARYNELTKLNDEYAQLAEISEGREKELYTVKQQECIREAFIISHCLDKNVEAGVSKSWNVSFLALWMMLLPVSVIAAAVISSKTAGEMRTGTIKTLYALPVTRIKQYFAKLTSTAFLTVLLCAAAWVGSVFGAMIGCGGISYKGEYIRVLGEKVTSVSFFAHSIELTVCIFISALILTAFSAAISTTTRSQGAAVALTAILCAGAMIFGRAAGGAGNIVSMLSIITVLDVSAPIRGIPNYASAGYIVSWLTVSVYWLAFIICGYLGMRKDA